MEAFERGFDVKAMVDLCAASHGEKYHKKGVELLNKNLGKSIFVS